MSDRDSEECGKEMGILRWYWKYIMLIIIIFFRLKIEWFF